MSAHRIPEGGNKRFKKSKERRHKLKIKIKKIKVEAASLAESGRLEFYQEDKNRAMEFFVLIFLFLKSEKKMGTGN